MHQNTPQEKGAAALFNATAPLKYIYAHATKYEEQYEECNQDLMFSLLSSGYQLDRFFIIQVHLLLFHK